MLEERELKRKKRQEELKLEEEKKQQLEIEKMKMQNAKDYYERHLMIKYGIIVFGKLVEEGRKMNRMA